MDLSSPWVLVQREPCFGCTGKDLFTDVVRVECRCSRVHSRLSNASFTSRLFPTGSPQGKVEDKQSTWQRRAEVQRGGAEQQQKERKGRGNGIENPWNVNCWYLGSSYATRSYTRCSQRTMLRLHMVWIDCSLARTQQLSSRYDLCAGLSVEASTVRTGESGVGNSCSMA